MVWKKGQINNPLRSFRGITCPVFQTATGSTNLKTRSHLRLGSPPGASLQPAEGQLMQTPAGAASGDKHGPHLPRHLLRQLQKRASQPACWQLWQKKGPSSCVLVSVWFGVRGGEGCNRLNFIVLGYEYKGSSAALYDLVPHFIALNKGTV